MNDSWHTYPKIFSLGHKCIADLLLDEVIVEEKIDGSFYSFGIFNGELRARSKGKILILDAPEALFITAVEETKKLAHKLTNGWTYRAEYLAKPHHNALAYERVPNNHLIIFDINTAEEEYLTYEQKTEEANRIGLEVVPLMYKGIVSNASDVLEYLERISVLKSQKIEGVVIKNYHRFGPDKKVLMGKYVSEAFKEVHKKEWKAANKNSKDIIQLIIESYQTPARWNKAVQHLSEAGELNNSPQDIGKLIKEVPKDILDECKEEIIEKLMSWAWPQIQRGLIRGLPDWYKKLLLEKQFQND